MPMQPLYSKGVLEGLKTGLYQLSYCGTKRVAVIGHDNMSTGVCIIDGGSNVYLVPHEQIDFRWGSTESSAPIETDNLGYLLEKIQRRTRPCPMRIIPTIYIQRLPPNRIDLSEDILPLVANMTTDEIGYLAAITHTTRSQFEELVKCREDYFKKKALENGYDPSLYIGQLLEQALQGHDTVTEDKENKILDALDEIFLQVRKENSVRNMLLRGVKTLRRRVIF